jgi:hypothetical protein
MRLSFAGQTEADNLKGCRVCDIAMLLLNWCRVDFWRHLDDSASLSHQRCCEGTSFNSSSAIVASTAVGIRSLGSNAIASASDMRWRPRES